MGNQLTVVNMSDNDVIASAQVNHLVVDKLHVNVGIGISLPSTVTTPSITLGLDLARKDDSHGSLTIRSGQSWTWPMTAGRYRLTLAKNGSKELICDQLEIPWHTNITLTPDGVISYVQYKDIRQKSNKRCVQIARELRKMTGVPLCIVKLFVSELSAVDSTSQHIMQFKSQLRDKCQECSISSTPVSADDVRTLLTDAPFNMANDDVAAVINKLLTKNKRRKEVSKLLCELSGPKTAVGV